MLEHAADDAMPRHTSSTLDRTKFTELYQVHLTAVFNYCLFRTGERAIAEDLTADTFERAWRARGRFESDRVDATPWLFTIARRVVIDYQRRRARRPLIALNDRQSDFEPLPEAQVESAERLAHLQHLILALDSHEQELIALKFGAGMSNRQIARTLRKNESAIGSAIYRIMQKLRARWETRSE